MVMLGPCPRGWDQRLVLSFLSIRPRRLPASASRSVGLDFSLDLLAPVFWNLQCWELGLTNVMEVLYNKYRQSTPAMNLFCFNGPSDFPLT